MFLILIIASLTALVASGMDWGLPSRHVDRYLFASHHTWTGEELSDLDVGRESTSLGADVDRNPVGLDKGPVTINRTELMRAEILRRYRLYSSQPDEMITFMALQGMKPHVYDFDPRLYQYGGLWIYPVGALLKATALLGWIDLRPDVAFYYENPAAFGKFYVVARAYTLAWYAVLLACAAAIARRVTQSDIAAAAAALLVGLLPVVFAMAHEAKPHLPGAALMLLTCLAADRWVQKGRHRDAIFAGLAAGLASGMILSAAVIGIVLPVMIFLRRSTFGEPTLLQRLGALALSLLTFVLAYAITNPYVPVNLVQERTWLQSNLGNSKGMYDHTRILDGLRDGWPRLIEAASVPVAALIGVALIVFVARRKVPTPLALLLSIPSGLVLAQFFALAAEKPAEYARFALLPTIAIAIAGVWAISLIGYRSLRVSALFVAPLTVLIVATQPYISAFLLDAREQGTRELASIQLAQLAATGHDSITLYADPAPYSLPPVDLWRWQIWLSPKNLPPSTEVVLRPIDYAAPLPAPSPEYKRLVIDADQRPAPITWANKPFEILIRGASRPTTTPEAVE